MKQKSKGSSNTLHDEAAYEAYSDFVQKGPPRKLRSGEALKKPLGSKSSKGSQQLDISHQGDDNDKICGDDSSPEQDKSDDG